MNEAPRNPAKRQAFIETALKGKTIQGVEGDCVNVLTLTFTDGTSVDLEHGPDSEIIVRSLPAA